MSNNASDIKRTQTLVIRPNKVFKLMMGIIILLLFFQVLIVASETAGYQSKITEYIKYFFNFHSENNFTAFFSSLFLVFAGLLSLILGCWYTTGDSSRAKRWKVLGFLFFFLAFDEAIQIHEVISRGMRSNFGDQLPGFLHYAWVVPYALLVLGAVAYFFKFVWNLPSRVRNLIFIAGLLYVFGALGLEVVESYVFTAIGEENLLYISLVTIEESLEMLGIAIVCYALLAHISSFGVQIVFFENGNPGSTIEEQKTTSRVEGMESLPGRDHSA